MPNWFPLRIPLNKGLEQHEAENAFESEHGLTSGINLDFGKKGAVRGRPGWTRTTGFTKRLLSDLGLPSQSFVATKALTGYSGFKPFEVQDGFGRSPALMSQGRIYVQSEGVWQDRGGGCAMKVTRLPEYPVDTDGFNLNLNPYWRNVPLNHAGLGYDFGPSETQMSGTFGGTNLMTAGEDGRFTGVSSFSSTFSRGVAARCGTVSALLTQVGASLYIHLHTEGSSTTSSVLLATDCRVNTSSGTILDMSSMFCICCDYDSGVFFVSYFVDPAVTATRYRVLRVSTAGVNLLTASFASPVSTVASAGQPGMWITNTSATTNKVVLAMHGSTTIGVQTTVLNATTLVTLGIDATLGTTASGTVLSPSVVCGVAENDEVWVCYVAAGTIIVNSGISALFIWKRSLTTTSSRKYLEHGSNSPSFTSRHPGRTYFCHHQPIKFGGRTLFGLSVVSGMEAASDVSLYHPAATWYVLDLTDLWSSGIATGSTSGNLIDPMCVAQGPFEGSSAPYSPSSAMLSVDGLSYRFQSIDWTDVASGPFAAVGAGSVSVGRMGYKGRAGMNQITFLDAQVAGFSKSTIIAGSVPRALAGGSVHPVGFLASSVPNILSVTLTAGGSYVAGSSYTVSAVYVWMDESGNIHRSMIANSWSVAIPGGANQNMVIRVDQPHFTERIFGNVKCEVYVSEANPPAGSIALYRVDTFFYDPDLAYFDVTTANVDTTAEVIYTAGGVLSCQPVRADGGVATVGNRCWVSDGKRVYASRLGDESANNEAVSWHIDDTLALRLPTASSTIIGLAGVEDRLAILADNGVWMTTGEGPDDLGQGAAFRDPVRMANVGCAGQRSIAAMKGVVVFQASDTFVDGTPETGGLWALSGGQPMQISAPVRDEIGDSLAGDVVYNDGRDILYWSRPTTGDLLVFDGRVQAWTKWTVEPTIEELDGTILVNSDPFTSFAVAQGTLWGVADEPAKMTGAAGTDALGQTASFPMSLRLSKVAVSRDPGGWARCRSVQLIQDPNTDTTPYNVTVDVYDGAELIGHTIHTALTGEEPPSEAFNNTQKCSTIDIELSSSRATVVWTGLVLSVKGLMRTKQGPRNYH